MDYYGFVYLWFDTKHKKYIIGSHHGRLEDGYTTTTGGKHVQNIFKSRPSTMKRRILEYNTEVNDYLYTQELEQKWLDKRPNISNSKRYYNQKSWATGGIDSSVKRTKPDSWRIWKSEQMKTPGAHPFTSENCSQWAKERIEKGTHHFIHSNFNKKPFILLKNGKEVGKFTSKVEAVKEGFPAHLIDKLRKQGTYTTQRNAYKNRKELFKKGDTFAYQDCP